MKTLASIGAAGLALLGTAKTINDAGEDYSKGLPSVQVPETSNADALTKYLKRIAYANVVLDPKHTDYLKEIEKYKESLNDEQRLYLNTIHRKQYNLQWDDRNKQDGSNSSYKQSNLFK
jgi:hypothetical protein